MACLSACKQDTLFTAPFEVAATTSKNGIDHSHEKESGSIENRHNLVSEEGELSTSGEEQPGDIFYGDSLRHREVHKRQIAPLLQKFENSHFFVRISESNEPLWSRRNSLEKNSSSSETNNQKVSIIKTKETAFPSTGAVIDRGNFDATTCGGTARNFVKCFALQNGDIVVCTIKLLETMHMNLIALKLVVRQKKLFATLKLIVRWHTLCSEF